MKNVALYLAIEPWQGRPVALARLTDSEILRTAGEAAIKSARRRAAEAVMRDDLLGKICTEEAQRLQEYLGSLIPGLPPVTTNIH
jgi:hypothetical protein